MPGLIVGSLYGMQNGLLLISGLEFKFQTIGVPGCGRFV